MMKRHLLLLLILASCLTSCKLYKQNILFKTDGDIIYDNALKAKNEVERNYQLQADDKLQFQVFSNDGQEVKWIPALMTQMAQRNNQNTNLNADQLQKGSLTQNNNANSVRNQNANSFNSFLVGVDGNIHLPMIGTVQVLGKTLFQLDSMLTSDEYFGKYFKGSYVKSSCVNRRVIILKGEQGSVMQLSNENISIIEAIALSGGVPNNVRATNIRIIRGDLRDPNVYEVDLSTIEGMRRVNLTVRSGDILYLEPIRKTFLESINDFSPLLGLVSSVATLITTIILLNKK